MVRKPNTFPYEAFVESKVEQYFRNEEFDVKIDIKKGDIERENISCYLHGLDILATRGDEEWRIECKGDTANISVNFNTVLGQILRRMDREYATYAVAMPDIQEYRNRVNRVPKLVRKRLSLRWIWVKESGEIDIDEL